MSLLRVENLTKSFGGVQALSDLSFEVNPSSITGVIGPNGSGKTTFFNLMTGFLKPDRGQITFENRTITRLPSYVIASMGIVRTYQVTSVYGNLSVADNVRIATHVRTHSGILDVIFQSSKAKRDRSYATDKVSELLEFIGLKDKGKELASTLPYGDQRKLELAIALATGPRVLLLDEPAAGMNQAESNALASLVRQLRSRDMTVLIVEHNMKLIMELCDHVLVLDHGVKLAEDMPEKIVKNPEVIKVYFGEELEFA